MVVQARLIRTSAVSAASSGPETQSPRLTTLSGATCFRSSMTARNARTLPWISATTAMRISLSFRHARTCCGHPRLCRNKQDMDSRVKPGHDEGRSGRVLPGVGRDLRMGRKPDAWPRLRVADQLFDDPDARAVSDDVRVRRDLADAAFLVSRVELAAEDVEH